MSVPNTYPMKRRPTHPGEMLAEDFMPDSGAVVEIAWDEPIDIMRPALFKRRAQGGVPHLTGINRPDVQHIRATRQGVPPEVEVRFVAGHGIMGLAIQDRDGAGIAVLFRSQSPDELIQRLQVRVIARLPERVDDDWMNLAGG